MSPVIDDNLGNELEIVSASFVIRGSGLVLALWGIIEHRSGRQTWTDQHIAPIVPNTLAAIGTSMFCYLCVFKSCSNRRFDERTCLWHIVG